MIGICLQCRASALPQTLLSERQNRRFQPLPDPFAVLEDLVSSTNQSCAARSLFPETSYVSAPHTRPGRTQTPLWKALARNGWETLTEAESIDPCSNSARARDLLDPLCRKPPFAFSNPCWHRSEVIHTRSFDLSPDSRSRRPLSKRAQAPAKRTLWQDLLRLVTERPSARQISSPLTPSPTANCGTASALFSERLARCETETVTMNLFEPGSHRSAFPREVAKGDSRALRNFDEAPSIPSRLLPAGCFRTAPSKAPGFQCD